MRNRLLKEALTRERRSTAELRHQQQRQQVETRAALSIVAASSTDELTTIVDNEREVKVWLVWLCNMLSMFYKNSE